MLPINIRWEFGKNYLYDFTAPAGLLTMIIKLSTFVQAIQSYVYITMQYTILHSIRDICSGSGLFNTQIVNWCLYFHGQLPTGFVTGLKLITRLRLTTPDNSVFLLEMVRQIVFHVQCVRNSCDMERCESSGTPMCRSLYYKETTDISLGNASSVTRIFTFKY